MPKDKNKKSKKEQFIENFAGNLQEGEKENDRTPSEPNRIEQQQQQQQRPSERSEQQQTSTIMSNIGDQHRSKTDQMDSKLEQKQRDDVMSEKLSSILKLGLYPFK